MESSEKQPIVLALFHECRVSRKTVSVETNIPQTIFKAVAVCSHQDPVQIGNGLSYCLLLATERGFVLCYCELIK